MTPTQEDHEAAARKVWEDLTELRSECECRPGRTCLACIECQMRIAAALSEAVRVAVEKDRDRIARMVRRELDAVMNLDIAIRSDAQATPAPEWPPNSWTPPETGEKEPSR